LSAKIYNRNKVTFTSDNKSNTIHIAYICFACAYKSFVTQLIHLHSVGQDKSADLEVCITARHLASYWPSIRLWYIHLL